MNIIIWLLFALIPSQEYLTEPTQVWSEKYGHMIYIDLPTEIDCENCDEID